MASKHAAFTEIKRRTKPLRRWPPPTSRKSEPFSLTAHIFSRASRRRLVAYEMARQLLAAGEPVDTVIMLDTPRPEKVKLSKLDRLVMKLQDLKRERGDFLKNWLRRRREWREFVQFLDKDANAERSDQFHNGAIASAFYRAIDRYDIRPYTGRVLLLRPVAEVAYRLTDGRQLNDTRSIIRPDNGWTPYVKNLKIIQVSGTHDTMCSNHT